MRRLTWLTQSKSGRSASMSTNDSCAAVRPRGASGGAQSSGRRRRSCSRRGAEGPDRSVSRGGGDFEGRGDRAPDHPQHRALRRLTERDRSVALVRLDGADQMQCALRARHRHIQQPCALPQQPLLLQQFDPPIDRIRFGAFGPDRRQHDAAVGPRDTRPAQQLSILAAHGPMQTGNDDGVKLQTFRSMDRHQFDLRPALRS